MLVRNMADGEKAATETQNSQEQEDEVEMDVDQENGDQEDHKQDK